MSIFIPMQVFTWVGACIVYGLAGGLLYAFGLWCHNHPEKPASTLFWYALGLSLALSLLYNIAITIQTAGGG